MFSQQALRAAFSARRAWINSTTAGGRPASSSGGSVRASNQGLDDSIDSDTNTGGLTDLFAVTSVDVRFDLDSGLIASSGPSQLGGNVWYDTDEDGILGSNEPRANGEVTVELLDLTGAVLRTSTPAVGAYFYGVPPGIYRIRFVIPAGYGFTAANQGADEMLDSDVTGGGTTDLITYGGGIDMSWNAGLVEL